MIAATRTTSKMDGLRRAGAQPVVVNGLDRDSVMKAVVSAQPDAIVHQMTGLATIRSLKKFDDEFALTNRLRTEGTAYLIEAARAAGARKLIAQSYTGWPNVREGNRVKTEEELLDPNPPKTMSRTLDAIRRLEASVSRLSDITGIVLRYGSFYGPGTSITPAGNIVELVRQRKFPIFGNGAGVWSFIHIDDAAAATVLALEGGAPGIYNIVDDEPAEVYVWLPDLAEAIGARPPYHLPAWLGRLVIGEAGISMMTKVRGSSNAKAKSALPWQLDYATWRDGFRRGFREHNGSVRVPSVT
ncbi:MAG: NAD-dependent epimerase/dehydratase [Candidatus Acidoferrum typicum]|nr:NAD-dependent epimerase/dehydratase [Candidatus Acidoferrum typicum]